MIGLVGSLKILATQQFEDAYLRSSRDDNDDDDGGGQTSAPSRGSKRRDLGILLLPAFHTHTFFFYYLFIWP